MHSGLLARRGEAEGSVEDGSGDAKLRNRMDLETGGWRLEIIEPDVVWLGEWGGLQMKSGALQTDFDYDRDTTDTIAPQHDLDLGPGVVLTTCLGPSSVSTHRHTTNDCCCNISRAPRATRVAQTRQTPESHLAFLPPAQEHGNEHLLLSFAVDKLRCFLGSAVLIGNP